MEVLRNLITRLRSTGVLLLVGLLLIIYIALGFLYLQQGAQQTELEEQIVRLSAIVSRGLSSVEQLQTEYEAVNSVLAPMTDKAALDIIVSMAENSGIDIDPDAGKFSIPPVIISQAKVGGGTYQLLSFRNIHVQGDDDAVMAFISDLDSGKTRQTIVLTRVTTSQVEIGGEGEETKTETKASVDVDIYTKP